MDSWEVALIDQTNDGAVPVAAAISLSCLDRRQGKGESELPV
jgi:hypothetical protein